MNPNAMPAVDREPDMQQVSQELAAILSDMERASGSASRQRQETVFWNPDGVSMIGA